RRQSGVVQLAREVLEEAFQLVEIAVCHRQETSRVGVPLGRAGDRLQRDLQLRAKTLDASSYAHQLAALEAAGEQVGVAEGASRDRACAVGPPDRPVWAAVAGAPAVRAPAWVSP